VENVLIEIGSLVNWSTIVRCSADARLRLEYYHLELADPDGVFAEGAPSETLVVSDDCCKFDNWSERSAVDQNTTPTAPRAAVLTMGARRQVPSRLRSAFAPLVDRRTPFDKLRDRIEERGQRLKDVA
jgi:hypothetical protein